MTFYDYYRMRMYQSLASIQQAFALNYLYGPAQKAGDARPSGRPAIPRLPMNTIAQIILQEQAVKDARPGITMHPLGFRRAGQVADGADVISKYLTGTPGAASTFGLAVGTIRRSIENERA